MEALKGNSLSLSASWILGRGHTKETGNRNTTVISENCYQPELNTCSRRFETFYCVYLWTHVTAWSNPNWGNGNIVSSRCAAPVNNMCSTQADNSSRKFRLRCGCQFPWCALALSVSYGRSFWYILWLVEVLLYVVLCSQFIGCVSKTAKEAWVGGKC
jgi:hypothetical protein